MAVEVINISKEYEPILNFLYPQYTWVETTSKFSNFIIHKNITRKVDREALDHQYVNCVFISTQIFDQLWDEDYIKERVLEFARITFKSKKKILKTLNSEGPEFVAECVSFLFTGQTFEDQETKIDELFRTFGSQQFHRTFLKFCQEEGVGRTIASVETFITKVLTGSESLYYKKAAMRLGSSICQNLVGTVSEQVNYDPLFTSAFPDLVALRTFTNLMKREYYG